MSEYSKWPRGSEWRKWDLHIHTPGTKKNDDFDGSDLDDKWGKFIQTINESDDDIRVVGITDYFCIENYFKFKKAIKIQEITRSFDLVLPNIELRINPVAGTGTPVNIHCIFNPEIENEIENRFLGKLKMNFGQSDYSAKKEELIRLGKSLPGNAGLDDEAARIKGLEQYVISFDVLRSLFQADPKLKENTIVVVSNKSSDGNSGIVKHEDFFISESQSQLDATRWSIYQFSDAIFSSNEKDTKYFLAKGADDKKKVVEKCRSLKPCFHGSDAHKNEKIFHPDENRFCWIKGDPTFSGLWQTIYEPEDRVKIQALKPDVKNERYLIDNIRFNGGGDLFTSDKIFLNENLNSIIGGKSSGKSLLLYTAAKSIDPEQVERASKRLNFDGYKFTNGLNFEVIWKNGEKDELNNPDTTHKIHKISYIPQLYINYLVEKNNKDDLNALIKNILLQDGDFREYFEGRSELITSFSSEIDKLIASYFQLRNKINENLKKSKELGKSDAIENGMKKIQTEIDAGQKASSLTKNEFESYEKLNKSRSDLGIVIRLLEFKSSVLSKIRGELNSNKSYLFGNSDDLLDYISKGTIDSILDAFSEIPADVALIRKKIEEDYDLLLANLNSRIVAMDITGEQSALNKQLAEVNTELIPFLSKIAGQTELKKLTSSLEVEKIKLLQATSLEKQINTQTEEYANLRKQIASKLKKRTTIYLEIVKKINDSKNKIAPEILLNCSLLFKRENFLLYDRDPK